MTSVRRRTWFPASLVLLLLVTGAQSVALAHAFEHDAGTLLNRACAICVTVSQLDSSCVDTPASTDSDTCHSCQPVTRATNFESLHGLVARQRSPPTSL